MTLNDLITRFFRVAHGYRFERARDYDDLTLLTCLRIRHEYVIVIPTHDGMALFDEFSRRTPGTVVSVPNRIGWAIYRVSLHGLLHYYLYDRDPSRRVCDWLRDHCMIVRRDDHFIRYAQAMAVADRLVDGSSVPFVEVEYVPRISFHYYLRNVDIFFDEIKPYQRYDPFVSSASFFLKSDDVLSIALHHRVPLNGDVLNAIALLDREVLIRYGDEIHTGLREATLSIPFVRESLLRVDRVGSYRYAVSAPVDRGEVRFHHPNGWTTVFVCPNDKENGAGNDLFITLTCDLDFVKAYDLIMDELIAGL